VTKADHAYITIEEMRDYDCACDFAQSDFDKTFSLYSSTKDQADQIKDCAENLGFEIFYNAGRNWAYRKEIDSNTYQLFSHMDCEQSFIPFKWTQPVDVGIFTEIEGKDDCLSYLTFENVIDALNYLSINQFVKA